MNRNLLEEVKVIIDKNEKDIFQTGKGFNLISILGMEHKETRTHSNIIAELLDSKGSHTYGNTFMKLFLEEMGISNFDTSNYSVIREEYVGAVNVGNGESMRTFLDIVIKENATGKVILIENKIWAEDQFKQLDRYYEHYKSKIIKLFYLNVNEFFECPSGNPEVIQVFENISYKNQIKNWLANCITNSKEKPFVNNQIEAYYQTILKLTNQNIYKKMNEEISFKLVKNEENFATGLQIIETMNQLKTDKINYLLIELKKQFPRYCAVYNGNAITTIINKDNSDFIYLGFRIENDYSDNIMAELKSKLESLFPIQNYENYIGWTKSIDIDNTKNLFELCSDSNKVLNDIINKFKEKIERVQHILNVEFKKM